MDAPAGERAAHDIAVTFLATEPLDASTRQALQSYLCDSEIEQLRRLRQEANRREYLCAHALLRAELSAACAVRPSAWRFGRDQLGRPLVELPALERRPSFSLSHTASLVGCAVAPGGIVGFDIEAITHIDRIDETVELVLSEEEKRAWSALDSPPLRTLRFYQLWTLKEALLKAMGKGLTIPPSAISIAMSEGRPAIRVLPAELGEPAAWSASSISLPPPHIAALAARRERTGAPRVRVDQIAPPALLAMLFDRENRAP